MVRTATAAWRRGPACTALGRGLARGVVVAWLAWGSWAGANAVCMDAIGAFVVDAQGRPEPCLVDLSTAGYCFALPGRTLEPTVWAFDAFLQSTGLPRPFWEVTPSTQSVRLALPAGDVVEIVLAHDGPFDVVGVCRVLTAR